MQKNKEKIAVQNKKWREANPQIKKERDRKWREDNKEYKSMIVLNVVKRSLISSKI